MISILALHVCHDQSSSMYCYLQQAHSSNLAILLPEAHHSNFYEGLAYQSHGIFPLKLLAILETLAEADAPATQPYDMPTCTVIASL